MSLFLRALVFGHDHPSRGQMFHTHGTQPALHHRCDCSTSRRSSDLASAHNKTAKLQQHELATPIEDAGYTRQPLDQASAPIAVASLLLSLALVTPKLAGLPRLQLHGWLQCINHDGRTVLGLS